jgi:hypothetical protein
MEGLLHGTLFKMEFRGGRLEDEMNRNNERCGDGSIFHVLSVLFHFADLFSG